MNCEVLSNKELALPIASWVGISSREMSSPLHEAAEILKQNLCFRTKATQILLRMNTLGTSGLRLAQLQRQVLCLEIRQVGVLVVGTYSSVPQHDH